MIYFIDTLKKAFDEQGKYSAISKPRKDVLKIFQTLNGSKIIYLVDYISYKKPTLFKRFVSLFYKIQIWFCAIIKCCRIKDSIVFFQYPFISEVMFFVLRWLKKRNKVVVLVHDIETIRHNKKVQADYNLLEYADYLIVHTPEMADAIKEMGCQGKIVTLEFFDYLVADNISKRIISSPFRVVFAGNLEKSNFLKDISKIKVDDEFSFYFYGKGAKCINIFDKNFVYKGFFEADYISSIEGNWGLVWDGTSINTCDGELGRYLRINAPFKMSLYIASNMPVIVWSHSAMAQYVKKYNLGIVVDSLLEIRDRLNSLSSDDLEKITESVEHYSEILRTGKKTRTVFLQVLKEAINY